MREMRSGRISVGSTVVRRGVAGIVGRVTSLRYGKARVRWTEHTETWTAIGNLVCRGRGRRCVRALGETWGLAKPQMRRRA